MKTYYQRYISDEHITVYDELMALGENVFSAAYAQDAWSVATEMMRRVQHNITILVPRLQAIGYHFGAGLYDAFPEEERKQAEAALPIYGPPTPSTDASIAFVEQHIGPLPYTLRAFYRVLGSVNLVGLFPHFLPEHKGTHLGYDPLFVYSIEMVIKMRGISSGEQSAGIVSFPIAPDSTFKYGYSGSGSYAILYRAHILMHLSIFLMGVRSPLSSIYASAFKEGAFLIGIPLTSFPNQSSHIWLKISSPSDR